MFFFYIDEAGSRGPRHDGSTAKGDSWLYVLTGVSLFEHRWHGFDKTISRTKQQLMDAIQKRSGKRLELCDCEIKSNWLRIPKERTTRPFISDLTDGELTTLADLYYRQLAFHNMWVFSVIVDKRHLHDYMDHEKLHRKSWELLCELVERFMRAMNPKHQAAMVVDDVERTLNRSLAMKHAHFQDKGTSSGLWLKHICEMPLFVRSELSNGIQLADLCGYNIYRAFKDGSLEYPFFKRIAPRIWGQGIRHADSKERPFSGLRVFPDDSTLNNLAIEFENKRASAETEAQK